MKIKYQGQDYEVFGVRPSSSWTGPEAFFLIFVDEKWNWVSCNNCKPCD